MCLLNILLCWVASEADEFVCVCVRYFGQHKHKHYCCRRRRCRRRHVYGRCLFLATAVFVQMKFSIINIMQNAHRNIFKYLHEIPIDVKTHVLQEVENRFSFLFLSKTQKRNKSNVSLKLSCRRM